jgi:hypothetical protein
MRIDKSRFTKALLITAVQGLYFPINRLRRGNRNLSIKAIDSRMPRISIFVIPYVLGILYLSAGNFIAALLLSPRNWKGHCTGFSIAMIAGFIIWIVFPARVTKSPFVPKTKFDHMLQKLHFHDKDYGQHNSFPSSHVYYINVSLHYLKKEYPSYKWFFNAAILVNALSTVFTHQHYVGDVVSAFWLSRTAVKMEEILNRR